ncbi:hypothetical protein [Kiloniella sp. EL199]|uniref:hypothetical protein n=1 Tax=Kiloniella sp. EL199 TaxID=2107581 RepID=UPI000EA3146A|nr:hypothetical protein [Kiloniella sp. EL199]
MSAEIVGYSFDDVPSDGFFYHETKKIVEIYFEDNGNQVVAEWDTRQYPCKLVIEKWTDALGRLDGVQKSMFHALSYHIGAVGLLLHAEYKNDRLELHINTTDDRYVTWVFISPEIRVELLD